MYFSSGEVAKQLSVSVRTLRYYDEIQLVQPSIRELNGKRLYSEEDLFQLQKVSLLKSLSLPLHEIKQMLTDLSIAEILTMHVQNLEQQSVALQTSIQHTHTLKHILELEGQLKWDKLLPLSLKTEEQREKQREAWLDVMNEGQVEQLEEDLPKLSEKETKKWVNLIRRVQWCLNQGYGPTSELGELIADDLLLLSEETFGGDAELMGQFWDIRKSPDQSERVGLYPVSADVIQFIEAAIDWLEGKGEC
ncbi:MerR family transcriptional regulator [Pontibacillus halophilus JSM 076056 = DSM 19796]|uniref:MerR family transcriptional regulator n=1 Tax=Pontibacillus halophilus JSM 076056 = DSM 19796 TaxID=1385510 RepID=A0A0A5GGK3_9BACI|nr:MerR family transcriptional regulator [Pontibacillus halophilus]KGX91114.1 MerR family transcriptional regulator [Pontibacillus halophilus JSM 076056 = DSM 19796]